MICAHLSKTFSCNEVYEAIQATVVYIQTSSRLWVLKMKDINDGLYFDMASKLDLANYEVSLVELGGKAVKLSNTTILIFFHIC